MFNNNFSSTRGEMPFTAKIVHITFLKNKKRELNLGFDVGIGQIKSGKWTGGERRRKHSFIV